MIDLSNRTVLVTGASRGVGAAVAETIAAAGGRVVLHYGASAEAARKVAAQCGDRALATLQADLSQPEAADDLWREAQEAAGGRIDALVNNAGVHDATPLFGDDRAWADGWRRMMQVNVYAAADLCRAAARDFRASGRGGRMVSIASRAAHRGDAVDHAAYAATKGALLAMTKTFARALARDGVLAYAVAPGWIDTEMSPQEPERRAAAVAEVPLGRMAEAREIGALVAFLLSDLCAAATGATIDVNGASYVR